MPQPTTLPRAPVNGRTVVKRILKKLNERILCRLTCQWREHRNEPLASIKHWVSLAYVSDWRVLMHSAPWSWAVALHIRGITFPSTYSKMDFSVLLDLLNA
jgi:hypothetical protein